MVIATISVVCILAVVIFFVAYFSPQKGQGIKEEVDKIRKYLSRQASQLPSLIKKITRKTLKFSQKTVNKSADSGKKSRDKSPF